MKFKLPQSVAIRTKVFLAKALKGRAIAVILAFSAGAYAPYLGGLISNSHGRLSTFKGLIQSPTTEALTDKSGDADDNDPGIDEEIGLAAAASDLNDADLATADEAKEVNEFAKDQDDDSNTTATVAQSPLMQYEDKSGIDLSYLKTIVGEMISLHGNAVETPPRPGSATWEFDRASVLADSKDRIGKDFKIPELLKERVGFWFDVYTKWDENHRVIHNSRYPWIVFKVIDVSDVISADQPKHLWMRREKADKLVKAEVENIKKALRSLTHKKGGTPVLTQEETLVAAALAPLGGDVRKQAERSLNEVRIQTGQKNFFESGLAISPRYLSTMEKTFAKYKLPVELTRIPFVESSFNKQATSKVGACGIWQFMGNTGRKFMLVNQEIDERRSPFKATEAAARLLKENHLILKHSWPLAVTAWNHGPGGVRIAAKAAGSNDLGVIVKKYRSRSFDFASSNFYSEFLAALHAERYSDIVFAPMERVAPVEFQIVKLHRPMRVKELLKVSGLSMEQFLLINPDLAGVAGHNRYVPVGFRVHVPMQIRPSIEKLLAVNDTPLQKRGSFPSASND